MSDKPDDADGAEVEEPEEVLNPYDVHREYIFSTACIESDTPHNVDGASVAERLAELYGDTVVLLRRQEVCEWFAELPAEEQPPPEAAQMKQAVASGAEPSPALLAAAYQCRVASLASNEVAEHDMLVQRRDRQIRDAEETRQQLIEAGEKPPPEETPPPVPPLSDGKSFILFHGYPASLPELTTLQSASWVTPGEGQAPFDPINLQTILLVNSKHPFKKPAEGAGDAKGKGAADPKKAKPPGKGKGKEEAVEAEALIPALRQGLAALGEGGGVAESPLREVHLLEVVLRTTWFGTGLSESEAEVAERLHASIEDTHDKRMLFARWRGGKAGREITLQPLEELALPPPSPPEAPAAPRDEPASAKPGAPKAGAKKGGGKPGSEGEGDAPPPHQDPGQEVDRAAPGGAAPGDVPCHRRYYDTLMQRLGGAPSLAALVDCLARQTVRNRECRGKIASAAGAAGATSNPFDFDGDCSPPASPVAGEARPAGFAAAAAGGGGGGGGEGGTPTPGGAPAAAVSPHEVEEEQRAHQNARHQDSLLDYIDSLLGRAEKKVVLEAKQREVARLEGARDAELSAGAAAAAVQPQQLQPTDSCWGGPAVAKKLFRIGQAVELTSGPKKGTRGTVVGHSRGRVGVHLADGARVGVVPSQLCPSRAAARPGCVTHGDDITLRKLREAPGVRGTTSADLDAEYLELLAERFLDAPPEAAGDADADADTATATATTAPPTGGSRAALQKVPPRQIRHALALAAFEALLNKVGVSIHLSGWTYEEQLGRLALLQSIRRCVESGMTRASAWYDAGLRQTLLAMYHPVGEGRCRWQRLHADFTGKVYFTQWLQWRTDVAEHRRVPEVFVFEEEEADGADGGAAAEGDKAAAPPQPTDDAAEVPDTSDAPAGAGAVVAAQPPPPAADAAASGGGQAAPTPEERMHGMREAARIQRLEALLEEGPAQHMASASAGATRGVEEEAVLLYPSDGGGVVTVSSLKGGTRSVRCSAAHEGVTVGSVADLLCTSGGRNPVRLAATFPDGSVMGVTSSACGDAGGGDSDGAGCGASPQLEYSCADGQQIRVHRNGEVEMVRAGRPDSRLPAPQQQHQQQAQQEVTSPSGGGTDAGSQQDPQEASPGGGGGDTAPPEDAAPAEEQRKVVAYSSKVVEPVPQLPACGGEGGGGGGGGGPARVVQVFDESGGCVHGVLVREVKRRVAGSCVICTMEDGTVTTLMHDGTVATLHHGAWLVTKNTGRHVIRCGSDNPEEITNALVSTNRDTESKALITTRDDLTLTVTYDMGDGSVVCAHSDGTLIWTRSELSVTSPNELNGTYKQARHRNGHPAFSNGEASCGFESGRWAFSDGTTACCGSANPGSVKAWTNASGGASDIAVSLKRQCRIEAEGFATVERCVESAERVQVNTTDDAVITWTEGTLELHKPDKSAFRIGLKDLTVHYQPKTIRPPRDDAKQEGVYIFDLLHGGLRVVDYDWTTFEVSLRGNVRITPYDSIAQNHPDTQSEMLMPPDVPVNRAFYDAARGQAPPCAPFSTQEGLVTLVPRQATEGRVPGGLSAVLESHPPELFVFDMCRAEATRFASPAGVLGFLSAAQAEAQPAPPAGGARASLTRSAVAGEQGLEEIECMSPVAPQLDLRVGRRLLPKVVEETQSRAGRNAQRGVPARGRVVEFNAAATSPGPTGVAAPAGGAAAPLMVVRRLLKFPELSEEQCALIRSHYEGLRAEERCRAEHAQAAAVADDPTEEEVRQDGVAAERLQEALEKQQMHQPRPRSDPHSGNRMELQAAEEQGVSYWHTADGLNAVAQCLQDNEKFKDPTKAKRSRKGSSGGAADGGDGVDGGGGGGGGGAPLVPQPPSGGKADASPHGQVVHTVQQRGESAEESPVAGGPPFDHDAFAKLEAIVCAGPHKQSLDAAKSRLKQKSPPESVIAVFEAICVLLNEPPSWARALSIFTGPMANAKLAEAIRMRRNLPPGSLEDLQCYKALIQPDKLAANMWELGAVANWLLSFTAFLEMLPQADALNSAAEGSAIEGATAQEGPGGADTSKNVYGAPRGKIAVRSLRQDVAHSDPNLGYLQKEVAKARTVKSCSNRDEQAKRRTVKETLAGSRVVLDPIELDSQVRAVASPPRLVFGRLREGAKYSQDITLTNMGQLAVRFNIKRMRSEVHDRICDLVSFVYPKGPVAPGMSCKIQVVVSAAQVIPDIEETIEIVTEAAVIRVPISATVRPGSEGGFKASKGVKMLGSTKLPQMV